MSKKPAIPQSQQKYVEQRLAQVEKERSHPLAEADIQRILTDLQSPDEQIRAKAVTEVCPCRVPWDVFRRLRKAVKPMQKDPSPVVRAHALHVEQDAREIEAIEALADRIDFGEYAHDDTQQRRQRHRAKRNIPPRDQ